MTSTADSITESGAHAAGSAAGASADPLAPILSLGNREVRVGLILGIIGALFLHTAVGVQAASTLGEAHAFAVLVRAAVRERLQAEVDVDLNEPPPPPPPSEPISEPEPEPKAPPPPPAWTRSPLATFTEAITPPIEVRTFWRTPE